MDSDAPDEMPVVPDRDWEAWAAALRGAALRGAAQRAYEEARIDGLCEEGAWERAVEVMRALGGGDPSEASEQGETHA